MGQDAREYWESCGWMELTKSSKKTVKKLKKQNMRWDINLLETKCFTKIKRHDKTYYLAMFSSYHIFYFVSLLFVLCIREDILAILENNRFFKLHLTKKGKKDKVID